MNLPKNLNLNKNPKTVEQNVNDVSRISQGAGIQGDLFSSTDIRVDGQVAGTLFSEGKVVVGESARLSGKLFATNIDFWGGMDGDIYVKDTLSLKGSSMVNGNIHVRRIQVEMGAQINGSIKMISEQEYDQLVSSMVRREAAPVSKPAARSAEKPFVSHPAPKAPEAAETVQPVS